MLIETVSHHVYVLGLIFIAAIVLLAPLAYLAGSDSRIDDVARRRRYNG